jgi:hypothetical protein
MRSSGSKSSWLLETVLHRRKRMLVAVRNRADDRNRVGVQSTGGGRSPHPARSQRLAGDGVIEHSTNRDPVNIGAFDAETDQPAREYVP